MLEFFQQEKKRIEQKIRNLHLHLRNASVGTIGDIRYKITKLEHVLEEYNKKIKRFEERKLTPSIFVYVLCTNKKNIVNVVDNELLNMIPTNSYSEKRHKWQPYCNQHSIHFLLEDFRRKEGYTFEEIYLDGQLDDETLAKIDKNIERSIAIIDLLSLSEENRKTCIRFDSYRIANILLPICDNLPKELVIYMKKKRKEVFKVSQFHYSDNIIDFYQPNIGEQSTFFQALRRTFRSKFKISNTIKDIDFNKSDSIKNINIKLD